jgi:general secretion pathway protein I
MTHPRRTRRSGFSLFEVLLALAIFLLAIGALSQTIFLANEQALAAEHKARATQLCQSKLAEVIAGVVPLESQNQTPFEEDENFVWSLECQSGQAEGLWNVKVYVARLRSDGTILEDCTLTQMVLDPTSRGSTQDAVVVAGSSSSPSSSPSSSSNPSANTGSASPSSGQQSNSSSQSGSTPSPSRGGTGATPSPAPSGSGTRTGGTTTGPRGGGN